MSPPLSTSTPTTTTTTTSSPTLPFCKSNSRYVQDNSSYAIAHFSAEGKATHIVMFGFAIAWLIFNVGVFLWGKWYFARVSIRPTHLVLVFSLAYLGFCFTDVFPSVVGSANYPCGFVTWFALSVMPLLGVCQFSRDALVIALTRFAQATMKYGRIAKSEEATPEEEAEEKEALTFKWKLNVVLRTFINLVTFKIENDADVAPEARVKNLRQLKFLISPQGKAVFILIPLFPFIILDLAITLADPVNTQGCTRCKRDAFTSYVLFAQCSLFFVFYVTVIYHLWKIDSKWDRWGFIQESRFVALWCTIAIGGYAYTTFAPVSPIISYDHMITLVGFCLALCTVTSFQVFLAFQEDIRALGYKALFEKMREHRNQKQQQKMKRKRSKGEDSKFDNINSSLILEEGSTATGGATPASPYITTGYSTLSSPSRETCVDDLKVYVLQYTLQDPAMEKEFEEFLAAEFSLENLLFLKDTAEWIKDWHDNPEKTKNVRARNLVKCFVATQGIYWVNLSEADATKLLALKPEDTVPLDFFDEARQDIAKLVEQGPCMRFHAIKKTNLEGRGVGGGGGTAKTNPMYQSGSTNTTQKDGGRGSFTLTETKSVNGGGNDATNLV
jgi:hypothetical protein